MLFGPYYIHQKFRTQIVYAIATTNKNIRLDVLSGDGANLVEGNVVLSKDMFNSYLSYSLYELRGGSL
ncbi:BBF_HP2_G0000860.mRNA.1.CDS.1 [Saccharomyces cerevisiae]|nr:BBF_HP2_G0000860.mRNA.1.CDS.1 [Saccharomyces cerevisiae]CAI6384360.1 BBF_HP1_G0000770.mRNA.1.CDS.1 [Saccharomyces cerevisiae]CAI6385118.1 BBF_HP2_G0000860.mRNA.1.CDS.1 [Saccharomyces cerevisiae]